ncbi:hypothetical protein AAFC00_000082 [Neodothiora populina]|uniref:Arrestin-like N-terminal domain-containing protein n=1 Tax=Neodothiora populina TaxID=2781224 RepID=A0ABR3P2L5_9PEZI
MLAHIELDQNFSHYTNLDIISGRVVVKTPSSTNISSIVVKLEGESRTRLLPPPNPNGDRQRAQLEFHKILYKIQIVFPPPDVLEEKQSTIIAGKTTFTLPPGQHEYPFRFKFPFNNDCTASSSMNPTVSLFGGLNVDVARIPPKHVKGTLPPTLTGFPGEAEIRYYLKTTVNRPSLFKENARAYVPFNFCPIEPPRPPVTDAQVFARRRHEFFNSHAEKGPSKSRMKSFLGRDKSAQEAAAPKHPSIAIDMRLPEPAILTCARELPLRILIISTNGVKQSMSLQSLQVELISITVVRAHDISRTEQSSTIIASLSNIGTPINFPEGSDEAEIDSRMWHTQVLPNTIPPSFVACNISRSYEIVTRTCIKYESVGSQPQFITADLRLPVQVFSGVTPPKGLLEALNRAQPHARDSKSSERMPPLPTRRPVPKPSTTASQGASHSASHSLGGANGDAPPLYSEAPPSYEDAITHEVAETLEPEHGMRRDYAPPPAAEDPLLGRDEKS